MKVVKTTSKKVEVKESVGFKGTHFNEEVTKAMEPWFSMGRNHGSSCRLQKNMIVTYNPCNGIVFTDEHCLSCGRVNSEVNVPFPTKFKTTHGGTDEDAYGSPSEFLCLKIFSSSDIRASYCPKYNILVACDMFHDGDVSYFLKIMRKLKKEGLYSFCNIVGKKSTKKKVVSLGADPEIEILNRYGSVEYASEFVERRAGSRIGIDGSGNQMELRPSPSATPDEITDKISVMIKEADTMVQGGFLSIKGVTYPLGGHIHIGVTTSRAEYVVALDDFLGNLFYALRYTKRGEGGYGHLREFRKKAHGLEYRTPSSLWLISPEFTRIVFKIVQNLCDSLLNNGEIEYENPPQKEDYIKVAGITGEEYDYFSSVFLGVASGEIEIPDNLVAAWKVGLKKSPVKKEKKNVRTYVPSISFHEDWDNEVKSKLFASLKEMKLLGRVSITLSGLHKDRGEFKLGIASGYEYTLPEGYTGMTITGDMFTLFLPRSFRMKGTNKEKIVPFIQRYIKEIDDVQKDTIIVTKKVLNSYFPEMK